MGGRARGRRDELTETSDLEDLVHQAAGELYGLAPEEFTAARDEQVRAARAAGNRQLATALGRLRRPTVSAYVLNLLVRDQPEVGEQLIALGEELRRAQEELSGPALRQLATQRAQLVGALVRSARKIAADAGHQVSQAVQYELEQTLHAALADPDVAAEVGSGRLTRAATRTGFDAAAPEPTKPVRRLRAVRNDERAEDPAVVRERRLREQRVAERAELQDEHDKAEEARSAADEALETAEQDRIAAAEVVEEVRERLAQAEDAEREAVRHEREAQRDRDAATRRRDSAARKVEDLAARLADF